jgi:O-methyltransferase
VTFRAQINTALQSTTGYRLTRETPEQRQEVLRKAADAAAQAKQREGAAKRRRLRAERDTARAERDTARAALAELRQSVAAEKAKRRRLKSQTPDQQAWEFIDDEARRIIETVTPRTMTGTVKLFGMIEALRYIDRVGVPGEIVESGVWRGGSMQAAALTLLECHDTERELHLFDTFQGMPPPSDVDVRFKDGRTAKELMQTSDKDARIWAIAGLDDVKQGMAETDYPSEKIFYHEGRVEETIPDQAPDQIALLRLDTDWYESTRHELSHLYDRLSPGGVLIIDDYMYWEGSYRATDEWLDETGETLFLAPSGPARIAVKPFGPRDGAASGS